MLRSSKYCATLKQFSRQYKTASYVYGHRQKQESSPKYISDDQLLQNSPRLWNYIDTFKRNAFRFANLNPLDESEASKISEVLSPSIFGLNYNEQFNVKDVLHSVESDNMDLESIVQHLQKAYCGTIGVELGHLTNADERDWLSKAQEGRFDQITITSEDRIRMLQLMLKSQEVDKFLASKFGSVKRYGCEGAEASLVFSEQLFRGAASSGVRNATVALSHRGKNNFLMLLMDYPAARFFRKMKGGSEFLPGEPATGDTFNHYHHKCDIRYADASASIKTSAVPNPSHLDAGDPVAIGKARSKMQVLKDGDYSRTNPDAVNGDKVMCLVVHGDAAVVGQGIVAEMLAVTYTPHFDIGGTVHLIVNNQLGFTTPRERGSSFEHCSDVGKSLGCPVLHVNAEDPEEVYRAAHIAINYRQKFRKSIFVNLHCYRRWGHNELDEPSFTQPLMYSKIRKMKSLPDRYAEQVFARDDAPGEEILEPVKLFRKILEEQLTAADSSPETDRYYRQDQWAGVEPAAAGQLTTWNTGIDLQLGKSVVQKSVAVPEDFEMHPTLLKTHVKRRLERASVN